MRALRFLTWALGVAACLPSASAYAGAFPDIFRVEGNRIVNGAGRSVVFRGLAIDDPIRLSELNAGGHAGPWEPARFAHMASWGATIVRLPIFPSSWLKVGSAAAFASVDEAAKWAADVGMYVYLEFHSIGQPTTGCYWRGGREGDALSFTPTLHEQFWLAMAEHYRDDRRVAFYELFNEPIGAQECTPQSGVGYQYPGDWIDWRDRAEALIDKIREVDPGKPILVGGVQYAYDLSFVPEYPVRRSNIAYAVHVYEGNTWRIGWDEAFGNLTATYPVFATETGSMAAAPFIDETLNYFEARRMSWTIWVFSTQWYPSLLASYYAPSPVGALYRGRLLALREADPDQPHPVAGCGDGICKEKESAANCADDCPPAQPLANLSRSGSHETGSCSSLPGSILTAVLAGALSLFRVTRRGERRPQTGEEPVRP